MSASKLIRPDMDHKESYLEALGEYHKEGRYEYLKIPELNKAFEPFLDNLNSERSYPHQRFQEWATPVPETVTWMTKDELYIGTVEIRHRLNWHLEKWGGHIHFIVRPSMRGKGFGKKMLLKAIPIINYLGIDNALLTVSPKNKAAIKVIESCGAVAGDLLPATEQFPERQQYWLDCT